MLNVRKKTIRPANIGILKTNMSKIDISSHMEVTEEIVFSEILIVQRVDHL